MTWEEAEEFQPLRELVERALVAYDWGEAFVVTNAVIKPHVDRLLNVELAGALAATNGDPILESIHFSLDEDARWHRQWSTALLRHVIADTPGNADLVSGWVEHWRPLAISAVEALAAIAAMAPVPIDPAAISKRITSAAAGELSLVLDPPAETPR